MDMVYDILAVIASPVCYFFTLGVLLGGLFAILIPVPKNMKNDPNAMIIQPPSWRK